LVRPGNAGADPANPQSWNMYGYTFDNPMSFVDPTGLTTCDQNGDNCFDTVTVNGNSGETTFCCSIELGGGAPARQQLVPPKPQAPGGTASVNQCAAATANNYSFAALTHTQNVPILSSLLSNYFSSASQLVFGPSRAGEPGA